MVPNIGGKAIPYYFLELILTCSPLRRELILVHSQFKRILEKYYRSDWGLRHILYPPITYFTNVPNNFNEYIVWQGYGPNSKPLPMKLSNNNEKKFILSLFNNLILCGSTDIELFKILNSKFPDQLNFVFLVNIIRNASDIIFAELCRNGYVEKKINLIVDNIYLLKMQKIHRLDLILSHLPENQRNQTYSLFYLYMNNNPQLEKLNYTLEPITIIPQPSFKNPIFKCIEHDYPMTNYTFHDLMKTWCFSKYRCAAIRDKLFNFTKQFIAENNFVVEEYIYQELQSSSPYYEIIEYLLDKFSVDIYKRIPDLTLLHYVVMDNRKYILKIFLNRGYDYRAVKNADGKTPYDIARKNRRYLIKN